MGSSAPIRRDEIREGIASRLTALLTSLVLLATLPGCTFIGLGIGAATPKHEQGEVSPDELDSVAIGTPVEVDYAPPGAIMRSAKGPIVARSADVIEIPEVLLPEANLRIPRSQIQYVRADKQTGSYWATGLLVGLGLDVIFCIATAEILAYTGGGFGYR
jgi:hypothetical protein